jgi:hypothetical protein
MTLPKSKRRQFAFLVEGDFSMDTGSADICGHRWNKKNKGSGRAVLSESERI